MCIYAIMYSILRDAPKNHCYSFIFEFIYTQLKVSILNDDF